jgi:DNA-binding response OmpR family regulator
MSDPVAQPKTVVLNVNDSDAMRFAISAMLKRADFEVLEAATGEEALTMIEVHEPHLVLLDVHLPGANGFEVCKRIRANPFRGAMRVLHTSAMSVSLEDKIESLESGADGFLEQPFELEALRSCVRSLLDVGEVAKPVETVVNAPRTDHVLQMLDRIDDGVLCLDDSWRVTFVNAMGERALGRRREELLGEVIWTAIPDLEGSTFGDGYRLAVTQRVSLAIEGLRPGFNTWMQARALPSTDGLLVLFHDPSAVRYSLATPRDARGEETTFVSKRSKTLRGI